MSSQNPTRLAVGAVVVMATCCGHLMADESDLRIRQYPWLEAKDSVTTLYDADPDHLWNRLHDALWVRRTKDGRAVGRDRLDPLLWAQSMHLLEGESHLKVIAVPQEFNEADGQRLIGDTVKRAMLQRDLWTVFDWVVGKKSRYSRRNADRKVDGDNLQRAERQLREAIVVAMRGVALSADDIGKLPDNFTDVVKSKKFAARFDDSRPDQPFLPPDLFKQNDSWEILQQHEYHRLTPQHFRRFPRSQFTVFLQLPQGHDAAVEFLKTLTRYKRDGKMQIKSSNSFRLGEDAPQLPVGTQFVLTRRALLIDVEGQVRISPIVESIQIRVFRALSERPDSQAFHEFTLSRRSLFDGLAGGLRVVAGDETDVMPSLNPNIFDELEQVATLKKPIEKHSHLVLHMCHACHRNPGIQSVNSFQNLHDLTTTRLVQHTDRSTLSNAKWRYSWGLLEGLWSNAQTQTNKTMAKDGGGLKNSK